MDKRLCQLLVKFLPLIALTDTLIGDSALLLYFSEFRIRSRNFAIVATHFPEFVVIYVFVLLCKSKVFWSIVVMIVKIKQDDNYF